MYLVPSFSSREIHKKLICLKLFLVAGRASLGKASMSFQLAPSSQQSTWPRPVWPLGNSRSRMRYLYHNTLQS